jgi:hypothetical protein
MKAFIIALLLMTSSAYADEVIHPNQLQHPCVELSKIRDAVGKDQGKMIELTIDQLNFLRGVYIMNPNTPPGIPLGDKALLIQVKDDKGGMIIFVDGERACNMMPVPEALVAIMMEIGGKPNIHENSY